MSSPPQLLYPSSRPGTPVESPTTQDNPTRRVLPNRERRATEKGHSWESQLSQNAKARAQREVTQKRKAEAEARPNSKAPGPIDTPSKRAKAESSQAIDESILGKPYEELTTDYDRKKWYRAALYRRDGWDPQPCHFDLADLKEMFDNPDAAGQEHQCPDDNVGEPLDKGMSKADNRPTSGPQHRPRDAAPPARLQHSLPATLHEPQAPATMPTNRTRSLLSSSAHAAGTYTPNPPSRGVGKPSPATPSQPPTLLKPSTSAKPSRNAAASASKSSGAGPAATATSNSNSAGPTRKVARPSDPRSKPLNQSSTAQKPKPYNVSSTRSAKHQKSRHKGGRRARTIHSQRQPAEDEGEGDDEKEDEDEGKDVKGGTSSRGSHKLGDFGELSWLVRAVGVRIKIRALKENTYADFTIRYTEPDENGEMHPNGYILDDWLTEEWRRVWGRHHPNDRVPRMQQQHVKWLYDRLSRLRNGVKCAVSPKINHAYNLNRKRSIEENRTTVERLGVDAFLSPTLEAGDCRAFHHPIFQEAIQDAFFSSIGRSFGYKHPKVFKPVPKGVYGLVATMEYATGIQVTTDLKGEEQLPWYEMFIGIYEDIEEYNYQILENVRMQTFDECYGASYAPPPRRLPVPPREFGPDTQDVYHSRVHVSDYDSDENMPFAPPTAGSSGSKTVSPHSSREPSVMMDSQEEREFAPPLRGKSSNAPVEELVFADESSS
ncbi:hypothetical protein RSAG8_13055, partial [Rhizoctonia solani AG-8 WAC10335]